MDLVCYLHPGWAPLIRPAPATRAWMDETSESFAYRCLPLNIANAHGWEVLAPVGFEAVWDGGAGVDALTVTLDAGADLARAPVSLFGHGVLTFHIEAIFRTPSGWNLWVGGSPNRPKDAIAPLTGIVETDWSPFTFTMNWRFTRVGQRVRFEAHEPICFLFPVQRNALEAVRPRMAPIADETDLLERFSGWSRARDAFHEKMAQEPPRAPADRWQKHYYRGVDVDERPGADDHRTKLRLAPFDRSAAPGAPEPPLADRPRAAPEAIVARPLAATSGAADAALAKRLWLLEAQERQRQLSPAGRTIARLAGLSREAFLDLYYAPGRPVILTGELADWPALTRWTPDYLAETIGDRLVEFQGGRLANPNFELEKAAHLRQAPFDSFIRQIASGGAGNDAYMTAFNSARNVEALAPLRPDMGRLSVLADDPADGMLWIGPAGTFTPLHHDLTNNLIVQIVGRKRIKLLPASEVGRVYNHVHVFSEIGDLDQIAPGLGRFPKLDGALGFEVVLEPGEALFVPLAWWHQVRALDFSVTATYTHFPWPNTASETWPGDGD